MFLRDKIKTLIFLLLKALPPRKGGIKAVLLYHFINDDEAFFRQMSYFKKYFRFVLAKNLSDTKEKDNVLYCTFDDGDVSNYEKALPVLERLGIKATFFITAGLLGKYIDGPQGKRKMMNAEQVKNLARKGHEIGAHTMTHPRLADLCVEKAEEEIFQSKACLEDLIGAPVVSFAYPYGNFNKGVRDSVENARFEYAFTTKEGLLKDNADRYLLPRIGLDEKMSLMQIGGKVSPAVDKYEKLRGRRNYAKINSKYKIAIIAPVPFYYHIPFYKKLSESPEIDLTVYYCSDETVRGEDIKKMYSSKGNIVDKSDLMEGYKYKFLRNYSFSPSFMNWPFGLVNFGIFSELKKEKFDAVVLQSWTNFTWWLAFLTSLIFRIPILFMTDSNILSEPHKSFWKLRIKKILLGSFLFKNSAGFLTSGKANEDFYKYYGVPNDKMNRIPFSWGYEDILSKAEKLESQRDNIRKKFGINKNDFVILYIGRLSKEKMPLIILDAFKRINCENKKLFIVGDGPMRAEFERYSEKLGINNITMMGFQPHEKIFDFFVSADLLVLPSLHETWGIVVNEAMCFGLPVVVSDRVGAAVDLVRDGYNGYVFPVGNVEKFSEAIERIINLPKQERKILSRRSCEIINKWVENFSSVNKIINIFKKIKRNEK
jgi:glycosyltransferase involved in cell wall biosynthesis/peptidoglycan/xylan/chitin deacetylase (PgdA/CDA1 family)